LAKGFTGCPCCAGRQLSVTNSFAARYPAAVGMWDAERNHPLAPDQVLGGTPDVYWWRCDAGPDHRWQVSPLVLGKISVAKGRRGCPFCAGKRASVTNSVASHPDLSVEWHPTRNGDLDPANVVASTARKLWWRCQVDPSHEWAATGANRTRRRGCPMCKTSLRSILEVCLAHELRPFVGAMELSADKVVVDGVIHHVDLLLADHGIVVEVDGRYRHNDPTQLERDARKADRLRAEGYRVIRVRERPLEALHPHDVVVPLDATVKQTSDAVLLQLSALGWLTVPDLHAYLELADPVHVDAAVAELSAQRPGQRIRLPGPNLMTREEMWDRFVAHLQTYVAREGHARVPWEHVEADGYQLGQRVGTFRNRYRRGRLAEERVAWLESLVGWTWDAVTEVWETGFAHLVAYRDREGHLDVPAHYWTEDGYPLGSWVRSHRRRGGRRTITEEQRARLAAIPGWSFTPPTQTAWDTALAALTAYATRTGGRTTARGQVEDGVNIDSWAKGQRARYHRGQLDPDRADRLEQVPGWSWRPQDDAWEEGYRALIQHVEDTGSVAVPRAGTRSGYPVASWAREQRARYADGTLTAARLDRLEAVPGWTWDPRQDSWNRHYAALLRFVEREGHAEVPTGHREDQLPLSSWVIRQRQDYKAGRVPGDRVEKLEALPRWTWDVLATRWDENFAAVATYAAEHGHACVPTAYEAHGRRLGAWVTVQRQSYRRGELDAERRARLEALPEWAWQAGQPSDPG
jgi:hypothetical protein